MSDQVDWNPRLRPAAASGSHAGAAAIETYDTLHNVEWQTRPAPLTDHESRLADALEQILGQGIHDLAGIVAALVENQVLDSSGRPFTERSFRDEMKRLGA